MTSSGTYEFNPSLGELVLYAFNMLQVRPTAILQEHMFSARMATNLMLADWSNKGVNLWKVDLATEPLVAGQATYDVDPSTVMMLDAYIRTDDGVAPPTDRIILPITRTEYASYPNKDNQAPPNVFWFDRLISPTVTLWPVPPENVTGLYLRYYRMRQIEDANFINGQTVDVPFRWLKAVSDGLALELSRSWAPSRVKEMALFAKDSYGTASGNDVEDGQYFISPMLGTYYRT